MTRWDFKGDHGFDSELYNKFINKKKTRKKIMMLQGEFVTLKFEIIMENEDINRK